MHIALLVFLVACGEPTVTGPHAVVGRLLDPAGAPVAGQTLESVEGRDVTDADGHFSVEWKPPSQHVDLERDGVRYSRALREEDVGQALDLRLPATRPALMQCERTAPCDLRLQWDLGGGFSASVATTCPTGEVVPLPAVPDATPVAKCEATPERPAGDAPIQLTAEGFILQDAVQSVRIEVHAEPGHEPTTCAVSVGGHPALPTDDGAFSLDATGRVVVTGQCDGRPTTPRIVTITAPVTVTLDWSALGPDLDLRPWLPGASAVVVEAERVDEGQGEGGWRLEVRPGADGVFHLPPLPRGTYRLSAGSAGPPIPMPTPPSPGALVVSALVRDADGAIVGLQGRLVVGADTTEGAVRVITP